ncbi:hypothetical protein C8R45DRAFT_1215067 [Mycena sanguinolenta]|nr:hypothetical protein C8R45DRAFT_1215067 [Mycena sanguinolenta]
MLFHDLDEDVVAEILLLCDIYSVISFLQVNRSFRLLALSKQLWISLVRDLSSRYFLPHLDAVDDCTTAQLIAKLKSIMHGPETWSPQSSVPPTVSFSKTFTAGTEARLLPGGRYLAVSRDFGELRCHDALTGRDIFLGLGTGRYKHKTSWEIDMLDDGHTAVFAVLKTMTDVKRSELSIVQVNLRTGHSDQLFQLVIKDGGLYYSPIISGDFLAMGVRKKKQRMVFLVNWREDKYAVFEDSSKPEGSTQSRVAIVPGHIILTTAASEPPNEQQILVYALSSIASCWRPVKELRYNADPPPPELRVRPEAIAPIIVERLEHNNRVFSASSSGFLQIGMSLHPNPIRHNAYKLMVHISDTQGTALLTYTINLDTSIIPNFSWTESSAFSMAPDVTYSSLSYSGYAVVSIPNDSGPYHSTIMVPCIVDPFPKHRWTNWAGQTIREVAVLSEGFAASSISSTGVVVISNRNGIEVCCYA